MLKNEKKVLKDEGTKETGLTENEDSDIEKYGIYLYDLVSKYVKID